LSTWGRINFYRELELFRVLLDKESLIKLVAASKNHQIPRDRPEAIKIHPWIYQDPASSSQMFIIRVQCKYSVDIVIDYYLNDAIEH